MRPASVALLVALAACAAPAIAGESSPSFFNGNDLYARLGDWKRNPSKDVISASVAYGFVIGVADAIHGYKEPRTGFCYRRPDRITTTQLVDAVYVYLEKRPQRRHLSAWSITAAALATAYPCN
jgi:hypothetical protein